MRQIEIKFHGQFLARLTADVFKIGENYSSGLIQIPYEGSFGEFRPVNPEHWSSLTAIYADDAQAMKIEFSKRNEDYLRDNLLLEWDLTKNPINNEGKYSKDTFFVNGFMQSIQVNYKKLRGGQIQLMVFSNR